MMRVINLGKPITGPGYYPGPSPAYLPEQVDFHVNGPGYYSCATPKVFIYKLTGGHPGGNRYPIAFFNTKEEAEKYIAVQANFVEDGYFEIVPMEDA